MRILYKSEKQTGVEYIMNFLKPDSPVMNLLSTIADLIVLNLLFVICSLPVITFGAAYSAKYYVAMKIVRGEDNGVIVPFFKAFIRNFKQSTAVWLIMIVAIALITLDWRWISYNGWANTALPYKIGIIAFSIVVALMTITIFPTIARYEMKTAELFKAALIFSIIKFIPLILILALMVGSVIACIWYAQWFPLIYVFCSTTITYFLCVVFIKQFDKLEKSQAEKLKALKESVEINPEKDAVGNISLAGAKKDVKKLEEKLNEPVVTEEVTGNRLTRFIKTERKKLKKLDSKDKLIYLAQYYLPVTVLILLFIVAVVWYGTDVYKSKMRVLGGGLINCAITEEGRDYATEGFLSWGGYKKNRTAMLVDSDFSYDTQSEFDDKYLEVAFRASIVTGTYDYMIVREDAIYNYATTDYFMDLNSILNMDNFTEDDFYYYVMTDEEKAREAQGFSLNDLLNIGSEDSDEPAPVALKLTDDIENKLGLDEQYTYYLAFTNPISLKPNSDYTKFVEYLFGKC